MYRKIINQLIDWKQDNRRKPLILEGARQTGKTYILQQFGKEHYQNVVYVNMENASDDYLVTGGMPEVVQSWITEKNIEKIEKIQDAILQTYIRDFSKHAKEPESIRIKQVFDSLPNQFAKRNDKFVYGVVREGARAREYELAIERLLAAGIARRVNLVKCGDKLPLRAYSERSSFKLYFIDVGLFRHFAKIPTAIVLDKTAIFDEFNGLLAEQYVLQELNDYELFYWTSEAQAEIDFVTQLNVQIVPIEVKSGLNVKAQSLKVYRDKYSPELAVRFSLLPLETNNGLFNIPLYYSFIFKQLTEIKN
jgi:predicted AAA+ superfamily ATPase